MLNLPKTKITSLLLVTLLGLGMMGTITLFQPSIAYAAVPAPVIGVVDFGLLLTQHPDSPKANDALKAEGENAQKEFDTKSVGMSDKDKQDLSLKLRQKVDQKRQELIKDIADKINVAIKEVAEADGLNLVVQKNLIVYENSGLDITDEVMKKIRP